jgi:adenylate cyclase
MCDNRVKDSVKARMPSRRLFIAAVPAITVGAAFALSATQIVQAQSTGDFSSLVTKSSSGFSVDGARTIELAEAKQLQEEGVIFIDVRSRSYPIAHIPSAVWLDYKTKLTAEDLAEVAEKDERIVFYCDGTNCHKSANASAKALIWGYTNVLYFAGGMPAWSEAGYPIETQ